MDVLFRLPREVVVISVASVRPVSGAGSNQDVCRVTSFVNVRSTLKAGVRKLTYRDC